MHEALEIVPDVRQSDQWLLVEKVFLELVELADNEVYNLTFEFLPVTIGQGDGPCELSILVSTNAGSLAFIEDRLGNAWLAHWRQGVATGQVRLISPTEDVGMVTQECVEALTDQRRASLPKGRAH